MTSVVKTRSLRVHRDGHTPGRYVPVCTGPRCRNVIAESCCHLCYEDPTLLSSPVSRRCWVPILSRASIGAGRFLTVPDRLRQQYSYTVLVACRYRASRIRVKISGLRQRDAANGSLVTGNPYRTEYIRVRTLHGGQAACRLGLFLGALPPPPSWVRILLS